jgi:mannosyltransferase OCH1-like enzyme
MIPKILHQTYKTADGLPELYKVCQMTAQELHPDWEYRFWTDEEMYAEVQREWPDFWPVFKALPRKIMQIDVFRYCLMYKYGGLYADLDYYFVKPFDMLDEHCVLPKSRDTRIGNCIFASEPGHPVWLEMIRDIMERPRLPIVFKNDVMVCDSEIGTGPVFVTRIVKNSAHGASLFTPERWQFHPEVRRDGSLEIILAEVRKQGSYGFHICTGLWRNGAL